MKLFNVENKLLLNNFVATSTFKFFVISVQIDFCLISFLALFGMKNEERTFNFVCAFETICCCLYPRIDVCLSVGIIQSVLWCSIYLLSKTADEFVRYQWQQVLSEYSSYKEWQPFIHLYQESCYRILQLCVMLKWQFDTAVQR